MPLTPEQFNKLVTKEEFNELKKDFKKMDGKIDQILTVVDGIATKHKDFQTEMASNQGAHDRMQKTAANHEIIIKKLEKLEVKTV
ncbi:MAG: hypothetical protein HYV53_01300 [Parcubacteria group bacterium]|nr:hypothetical protein [Parcubacteria group bacterium]